MPLGLGLGLIGFGAGASSGGGGGGGGYEAESDALFARFSTDPGSTRKDAINTCIASLKSAGVWAKLDALWVLAAHEEASALLNWVSTSHALTNTGGTTFTTDQGFTAGGSGKSVATLSTINTYTNFQQDSAHLAVWVRSNTQEVDRTVGSGINLDIYPRYTDDKCYLRINDSAGGFTVASSAGFSLGNRSGSTGREGYKNGVSLGSYGSIASGAVSSNILTVVPSTLTGPQVSATSIGASLDSTEQLAFYNALNTLKTAIGW